MLSLKRRFRDSQIVIITNFVVVSSVGIKRFVYILTNNFQISITGVKCQTLFSLKNKELTFSSNDLAYRVPMLEYMWCGTGDERLAELNALNSKKQSTNINRI